jgi:outer membrane protein assembly factor BamB
MTGFAAPTMATDGRRAYVMFANGDLAAFNLDGSTAWAKHLGVPKNMYGHAASLAVWPGRLVVQLDQDEGAPGGSKLLAFDAATGRQVWERSKPTHGSWSSPIVIEAAGRLQIITLGLPWVMSHALTDGIELWRADLMSGEIAPSPVYAGGLVLVVSPSGGVSALRPDGAGDISKSHVVWTADEVIPDITSPVSDGQLAFVVSTPGELACFETATGKILWQHELGVEVQASPALAGGELLVLGTKGDLMVVALAREFREVTRLKLEDEFYASPAMAGGRMFLRGVTNLWGLGNSTKAGDER